MRTIRNICAALFLHVGLVGAVCGADDMELERGVKVDKNAATEKEDHAPVLQYALAATVTLTVLVVVCMPSRKAQ